jgi:hypothetical protein
MMQVGRLYADDPRTNTQLRFGMWPAAVSVESVPRAEAKSTPSVLQLVAEIDTDMSRWPTAQHFTSWLTLLTSRTLKFYPISLIADTQKYYMVRSPMTTDLDSITIEGDG